MKLQDETLGLSVFERSSLAGRTCLVVGGAGFLGREFCGALAEAEGQVVIADSAVLVDESNVKFPFFDVDVSSDTSVQACIASVAAQFGSIDVLLNCAAFTAYSNKDYREKFFAEFNKTDSQIWAEVFDVNVAGIMRTCKHVAPIMMAQKKGSIINIGSDVGVIAPDQRIYENDAGEKIVDFNIPASYSSSKSAVIHLTKHMATLWARDGVRVNCLSPAGVYRNHQVQFYQNLIRLIPMGRMAYADEFNPAIVFLASDASSFMTGHNLVMDGGRTII